MNVPVADEVLNTDDSWQDTARRSMASQAASSLATPAALFQRLQFLALVQAVARADVEHCVATVGLEAIRSAKTPLTPMAGRQHRLNPPMASALSRPSAQRRVSSAKPVRETAAPLPPRDASTHDARPSSTHRVTEEAGPDVSGIESRTEPVVRRPTTNPQPTSGHPVGKESEPHERPLEHPKEASPKSGASSSSLPRPVVDIVAAMLVQQLRAANHTALALHHAETVSDGTQVKPPVESLGIQVSAAGVDHAPATASTGINTYRPTLRNQATGQSPLVALPVHSFPKPGGEEHHHHHHRHQPAEQSKPSPKPDITRTEKPPLPSWTMPSRQSRPRPEMVTHIDPSAIDTMLSEHDAAARHVKENLGAAPSAAATVPPSLGPLSEPLHRSIHVDGRAALASRGRLPPSMLQSVSRSTTYQQERIKAGERLWNSSGVSQFAFADRLCSTLLRELREEVCQEVASAMDHYVESLVDFELSQ